MITSKDKAKSMALVKSAFREYYFKHSNNIGIPLRMKDIFHLELLANFWPF
jgi:hypothetical protein